MYGGPDDLCREAGQLSLAAKRDQHANPRRDSDLSKLKRGLRAKYFARYRAATNLLLLSPEVAKYFPGEQSVNSALRTLIHSAKGPLRGSRGASARNRKNKVNSRTL
jgi:hypothetical protein